MDIKRGDFFLDRLEDPQMIRESAEEVDVSWNCLFLS